MVQKIFPSYGKVLIVDDKYEEVLPIQNILAENGVPYIFYDYNILKDKSVKKIDAVRIVFLDIRLEDGIQGAKNIATVLVSVLEKTIQEKNGPYIIVLWTNEIALKDQVEEYMMSYLKTIKETTLPTFICAFDKKEFVSKPQELFDNLSMKLEEQNMINFLIEWENESISVSSNMVRLMLYGLHTEMTNSALQDIFIKMAHLENSSVSDEKEATQNIVQILVEFLRDRYLEIMSSEQLINKLAINWGSDFNEKKKKCKEISIEQKACINSLFNINLYDDTDRKLPGKVYVRNDSDIYFDKADFMYSTLSNKWYEDDEIKIDKKTVKLNRKFIEVDITPSCDYAQNKNHMLRTIFGYIIEIGQVIDEEENKWLDYKYSEKIRHKIQYDYIYVTPELQVNNKLCVLVLNTKYITIENKNYSDKLEYLFRFNQDILAEIRKKCGDILTRIGINNL